jgi:hypothetical protein
MLQNAYADLPRESMDILGFLFAIGCLRPFRPFAKLAWMPVWRNGRRTGLKIGF